MFACNVLCFPESEVVRELEASAAAVEKKQTFRFSSDEVKWIEYMMEKHGDNFKV